MVVEVPEPLPSSRQVSKASKVTGATDVTAPTDLGTLAVGATWGSTVMVKLDGEPRCSETVPQDWPKISYCNIL